jgi:hypothetical protein
MRLIIASQLDAEAARLRQLLGPDDARILTPVDLSRPGWRILSSRPGAARFVADGADLRVADVTAVVTRLRVVDPMELVQIEPAARNYVAAEMTAMLKFWLATLDCPVVNPATDGSLCGPNWSVAAWARAARTAGLPVEPQVTGTAHGKAAWSGETVRALVLDDASPDDGDRQAEAMTRALAKAARVRFLSAVYAKRADGSLAFLAADPVPALDADAAALLVRYLLPVAA